MSIPGATDGSAPPRKSRLIMIGLVASIALNLLVLGAVASAYVQSARDDWPLHRGISRTAVSFVKTLPAPRQAELMPLIEEARARIRPLRETVGRQRGTIGRLLTADQFDKSVYDAEVKKLLAAETEVRTTAHLAMGAVMARLTADERQQLVQSHRNKRKGRGH